MTIFTTTNKQFATGNGVTTNFAFTFRLLLATDLDVYVLEALKVLDTDYTVAIDSDGVGGSVTFSVAPPDGQQVLIHRFVDYTQESELPNEDDFQQITLENALDKLTMEVQQLQEQLNRAILRSLFDENGNQIVFPSPDPGKALVWGPDGDGRLINYDLSALIGGSGNAELTTIIQEVIVGGMIAYAGTVPPEGFLFCRGQAVSRTDYAELFAAIGTTWGVGDGSTTFNLPDYRGRGFLGHDQMGGSSANRVTDPQADILGGSGGIELKTLSIAEMPTHSHTYQFTGHTGSGMNLNGSGDGPVAASTTATGGGAAFSIMNPYGTCYVIIRAKNTFIGSGTTINVANAFNSSFPELTAGPTNEQIGDILVYHETSSGVFGYGRLPVGADGEVLVADSGATEGVTWGAGGGGGSSSGFARCQDDGTIVVSSASIVSVVSTGAGTGGYVITTTFDPEDCAINVTAETVGGDEAINATYVIDAPPNQISVFTRDATGAAIDAAFSVVFIS